MSVYYNDNDPKCCAWLRELIIDGLIPAGVVDCRSITDIDPESLAGFTQCHFFAGIGGWPLALSIVGWPSDREVWTGSCPCQPFSCAGKGKGVEDERHLWPAFRQLVEKCRPSTIFGEQVASRAGREWLAGVRADLEALGYVVGSADLCAASVGAPHIRQRLWWVADTKSQHDRAGQSGARRRGEPANGGHWSGSLWLPCRDGKHRRVPLEPALFPLAHGLPGRVGLLRGAGNAIVPQVAAEFIAAFMLAQFDCTPSAPVSRPDAESDAAIK